MPKSMSIFYFMRSQTSLSVHLIVPKADFMCVISTFNLFPHVCEVRSRDINLTGGTNFFLRPMSDLSMKGKDDRHLHLHKQIGLRSNSCHS